MKKKLTGLIISAAVFGAGCMAACSPKAETAWTSNIKNGNFSIEYSFVSNSYDGTHRSISVKDDADFVEYITSLDSYGGTMQTADSEQEAYMFTSEGLKYYIISWGDHYRMSACWCSASIDGQGSVYCAYPPVSAYSASLNGDETTVTQNWEYFCNFYSGYSVAGAVVDNAAQTVELDVYKKTETEPCGKITLKYENYIISYSYVGNEEI